MDQAGKHSPLWLTEAEAFVPALPATQTKKVWSLNELFAFFYIFLQQRTPLSILFVLLNFHAVPIST